MAYYCYAYGLFGLNFKERLKGHKISHPCCSKNHGHEEKIEEFRLRPSSVSDVIQNQNIVGFLRKNSTGRQEKKSCIQHTKHNDGPYKSIVQRGSFQPTPLVFTGNNMSESYHGQCGVAEGSVPNPGAVRRKNVAGGSAPDPAVGSGPPS